MWWKLLLLLYEFAILWLLILVQNAPYMDDDGNIEE
jgi:hypothetical protein